MGRFFANELDGGDRAALHLEVEVVGSGVIFGGRIFLASFLCWGCGRRGTEVWGGGVKRRDRDLQCS